MTDIKDHTKGPESEDPHPCVLVFNANDPSGCGGLSADTMALASVGVHSLPVVTGCWIRDTAEIFDHIGLDEEIVSEQSRCVLEDINVRVIKVGFCGTPENLSVIAETCADYPDVPVVAYMPSLSWWEEDAIDEYLDAFKELILPQTTILIGNHSTLWRWLLPDWSSDKNPTPRDIAKMAADKGVPYTLVTGIPQGAQHIENALSSPHTVLVSEEIERFEAVFTGTGDTLSASLAGLLAVGADLESATAESLGYLDGCLDNGFRPGMGHVVPDRMFWAQSERDDVIETESPMTSDDFSLHGHQVKH